jgi:hypothetical protein
MAIADAAPYSFRAAGTFLQFPNQPTHFFVGLVNGGFLLLPQFAVARSQLFGCGVQGDRLRQFLLLFPTLVLQFGNEAVPILGARTQVLGRVCQDQFGQP